MEFPIEFAKVRHDEDFKNIAINVAGNALVLTVGAVALSMLAKIVVLGGSLITFIAVPLIVASLLVYAGSSLADKLFGEVDHTPKTAKAMPKAHGVEGLPEGK